MLERENINNFIADDLALRNRNWGKIEDGLAEKATVTELTEGLDERYTKVETDLLHTELVHEVRGGGENLWLNSNFLIPNELNGWSKADGKDGRWQDGKIVFVQASAPSRYHRIEKSFNQDIHGDVTVSIHAKMPETPSGTVVWDHPVGLRFKYPESEYPREQTRVEGWHTYSMVFTAIEGFVGNRIIRNYHPEAPMNSVVELAWEKLEQGTIPTPNTTNTLHELEVRLGALEVMIRQNRNAIIELGGTII